MYIKVNRKYSDIIGKIPSDTTSISTLGSFVSSIKMPTSVNVLGSNVFAGASFETISFNDRD